MNARNNSKQNCMPPNWGVGNFLSKCFMIYRKTNFFIIRKIIRNYIRKKNKIFWPKKDKFCPTKKKKGTLHLLSSSRSLIHLEKLKMNYHSHRAGWFMLKRLIINYFWKLKFVPPKINILIFIF
jgi:hypothetical protein